MKILQDFSSISTFFHKIPKLSKLYQSFTDVPVNYSSSMVHYQIIEHLINLWFFFSIFISSALVFSSQTIIGIIFSACSEP